MAAYDSEDNGVAAYYEEAMRGSISALHVVACNATLSPRYTSSVLPIILHHISQPIPESPKRVTSGASIGLQHYSLVALTHLLRSPVDLTAYRFCQEHWRKIWAWAKYFLEKLIVKNIEVLEDVDFDLPYAIQGSYGLSRGTIWTWSLRLFHFLAVYKPPTVPIDYLALMVSTSGLITVIARVWIIAAQEDHPTLTEASTLLVCLHRPDVATKDMHMEFRKIIEHSSSEIVTICIRRLNERLHREPEPDCSTMVKMVMFMQHCSRNSTKLYRAFIAEKSITYAIQAMALVSSRMRNLVGQDLENAWLCMGRCAEYLVDCFQEGQTWIKQAVEGRVLISMFKSLPRGQDPAVQAIYEGSTTKQIYARLFVVVTTFLPYKSVLQAVQRSIQTIDNRHLSSRLPRSGPLWEAWDSLCSETQMNRHGRTVYKELGFGSCSLNSECLHGNGINQPTQQRLKCCSICRAALYCSRECQRYSWNHGHRKMCQKIISQRLAGFPEPPSSADRDYMRMLLFSEFWRHEKEIEEMKRTNLADESNPPFEPSTVVTIIDFSDRPTKINLNIPEPYRRQPNYAKLVAQARSGQGNLVFAVFPSAFPGFDADTNGRVHLFTLVGPPVWEALYREPLAKLFKEQRHNAGI